MSTLETDANCPPTPRSARGSEINECPTNPETNCQKRCDIQESLAVSGERPAINSSNILNSVDCGSGDVAISQTRNDSGGCNPENPNSLTAKFTESLNLQSGHQDEPLNECSDSRNAGAAAAHLSKGLASRNPITGLGLGGDGVGGWKPIKPKIQRDGNPVTGEGYKPTNANDFATHSPSFNGANQVINKNRIPPGGFSSGLW